MSVSEEDRHIRYYGMRFETICTYYIDYEKWNLVEWSKGGCFRISNSKITRIRTHKPRICSCTIQYFGKQLDYGTVFRAPWSRHSTKTMLVLSSREWPNMPKICSCYRFSPKYNISAPDRTQQYVRLYSTGMLRHMQPTMRGSTTISGLIQKVGRNEFVQRSKDELPQCIESYNVQPTKQHMLRKPINLIDDSSFKTIHTWVRHMYGLSSHMFPPVQSVKENMGMSILSPSILVAHRCAINCEETKFWYSLCHIMYENNARLATKAVQASAPNNIANPKRSIKLFFPYTFGPIFFFFVWECRWDSGWQE